MSKCENCLHKKDCIDEVNFKYAKQCERFVPKMSLTQEEYLQRTSRCANCIHSKGTEDGYVYCYNSSRKNYPYAIDNFVFCSDFVKRSDLDG